jgi:hypothetical protein
MAYPYTLGTSVDDCLLGPFGRTSRIEIRFSVWKVVSTCWIYDRVPWGITSQTIRDGDDSFLHLLVVKLTNAGLTASEIFPQRRTSDGGEDSSPANKKHGDNSHDGDYPLIAL